MTEYEFHKAANIVPEMSEEQFQELKADIQKNGLHEPIQLYEGKIIDGRHRYRACQELGITPAIQKWLGEGDEMAVDYVLSRNLYRRQLSASQKAATIVDAEVFLNIAKEAKERQLSGLKKGNSPVNPISGERERTDNPEQTEGNFPVVPILGRREEEKGRSVRIAAKKGKVSHGYLSDAKKIKETAPEKFEQIKKGEKTIYKAMKEIKKENGPASKELTQQEIWSKFVDRFESFVYDGMVKKIRFPADISDEDRGRYRDARGRFNVLDDCFEGRV